MDVITLTGNLLLEWTFDVDTIAIGTTHRAESLSFQVGGKGINVSRILNRLGLETEAIAFADGALAALSTEWLEKHRVEHRFLPLRAEARPGLVIREKRNDVPETTFLGLDNPVPQSSWKAACSQVSSSRPRWLAICGSVPGWKPAWARDIKDILELNNPPLVSADTYGPPLEDLAGLPLDLVKINRAELQNLISHDEAEPVEEVLAKLRLDRPVKNWVITDGQHPVIASLENGRMYKVTPATIGEVSPTGSGDTFLAAILQKWNPGDPEGMLLHAGSCATANAASHGIGDFPVPVPERFQPLVEAL
jgi:fructose-1-phosphate kinase PfkB-like protein